MAKNGRFWRNLALIALAHVVLIAGLIRWSLTARASSNPERIVWLGGAGDLAIADSKRQEPLSPTHAASPIESKPVKDDELEQEKPVGTTVKSEIELPSATPKPTPASTPAPKPTATPAPKPKVTTKPIPKPKKALVAKASPKPSAKAKPSPTKSSDKSEKNEKKALVKNQSASQTGGGKTGSAGKGGGGAGGGSNASEFGWYGNMLHDRFYSAWIQPTTTVASGAKISTLVKVRIEKDGHVSKFEIIKPSENVVVNESVAAIAKRATQVDPLPAGLGNGDHYDVKINFELNTNQETAK
jgi:outer membrane biosynthesis protein TonB